MPFIVSDEVDIGARSNARSAGSRSMDPAEPPRG